MKNRFLWRQGLNFFLAISVLIVSQLSSAESKAKAPSSALAQIEPNIVVHDATSEVIDIIKAEAQLLQTDPDKYYQSIRKALEPHVSFSTIAIKVMGSYGKPKKGDTKEQIQKLREQRKSFTEAFTIGMVKTLGKGLATYADLKINTLPPKEPIGDSKSARIVQEVVTTSGQTRIEYHMLKKKTGEWLLVNVILDGINFRNQFQSQFNQLAKVNNGDIDKVIQEWDKGA